MSNLQEYMPSPHEEVSTLPNIRRRMLDPAYDLYASERDRAGLVFPEHTARMTVDIAINNGIGAAWEAMVADHDKRGSPIFSGEEKAIFCLAAGGLLILTNLVRRTEGSVMSADQASPDANRNRKMIAILTAGSMALLAASGWGDDTSSSSQISAKDIAKLPIVNPRKTTVKQNIEVLRENANNADDQATKEMYERMAGKMQHDIEVSESGGGYVKPSTDMQTYLRQMKEFDAQNDT